MKVTDTEIPGILLIEPRVFKDERGFFLETYQASRYLEAGIPDAFVQDNHSKSAYGILRGLHAQRRYPQGKLVRVVEGEIWDVAVDIRVGSPTFGQWTAARLSSENFLQLYVPPGLAHGFCVLSDHAQVEYKCTDLYHPEDEITVAWNDPELAIDWPLEDPVLSAKDRSGKTLAQLRDLLPAFEDFDS